jgi:hypothetical protein
MAQQLNGIVKDAITKMPIVNAKIITKCPTVFTDQFGRFKLPYHNQVNGHFSVRIKGYKIIEVVLRDHYTDTIRLFLNRIPVELQEIEVGKSEPSPK